MRTGRKQEQVAKAPKSKLPRPIKRLVIAYHEDEDGEPLLDAEGEPIPAVTRSYRVCPRDMDYTFVDSGGKSHQVQAKEGDLDFTSGCVTVKEEECDETGKVVGIHNLSHEQQYVLDVKNSLLPEGRAAFFRFGIRAPNGVLSRFNPHVTDRAAIIGLWEAQANSPDAFWVDGRAPTVEETAEAQKEYEKRVAEREKERATRMARRRGNTTTRQPTTVTDGPDDGDQFDEFTG